MTNEESKIALFSEVPVKYINMEFKRIISLVYSKLHGEVISSAEVVDELNFLYRVPTKRLEIMAGEDINNKASEEDLEVQEQLFELDIKLEDVVRSCQQRNYKNTVNLMYDLMELTIKFTNYLEDRIKEESISEIEDKNKQ